MLHIFYSILPIFILIMMGHTLKRKFPITQDYWRGAEKLTYYFFFPSLLITALINTNIHRDIHSIIIPLVLATIAMALILVIAQMLFSFDKKSFTSYFQGSVRYNSYVFIGSAVVLYGHKSIAIVAIVIAYMIILTNILSVLVLSFYAAETRPNIKLILLNIVKNPLIISCVIGVLLSSNNIKLISPLSSLLQFLGNAALPVSLLCVGAGLYFKHIYKNIVPIIVVNILKLICLPLATFLLLNYFQVAAGLPRQIALLYAAVPCAGNAYILAKQMGGDADTMAAIISTTTLFSLLTISIILH